MSDFLDTVTVVVFVVVLFTLLMANLGMVKQVVDFFLGQ